MVPTGEFFENSSKENQGKLIDGCFNTDNDLLKRKLQIKMFELAARELLLF